MSTEASSLPRQIGRYAIVGRLATGGMAEILLGKLHGPSGFERAVVVKRILPHLATQPSFVAMLLDEGRLAARIHHPNVVPVHELAKDGDDLFLVMEYLQGEAVSGIARRAHARDRTLDPMLGAHIVAEACSGLHAAHELRGSDGSPLGLVHRDVSPHNIFVTYDGAVKVLDFGIAKAADRITRTEAGMLKGKYEYMSPEQALGRPIDRRSDVFALGIVLYELTTRHRLFHRVTPLASLRAVTDDVIPLPSLLVPGYPRDLEAVCMRALERDPDRRHASAAELRRELLAIVRRSELHVPEEALQALMSDLFGERALEKRQMVERIAVGATPAGMPQAEVDPSVELPDVEVVVTAIGSRAATRALPARAGGTPLEAGRASRGWGSRAAGLVLLVALIAAIAIGARGLVFRPVGIAERPIAPALPSDALGATSAAPPLERALAAPGDEVPARVRIVIESTPPGAEVEIGGEDRGVTPHELRLVRGSEPVVVVVRAPGYERAVQEVVPDVDQRVRVALRAARVQSRSSSRVRASEAPSAAQEPRAGESSEDREPPRGFRRFN